ncbi:Cof-type HAD-IIB family hydrolase [Qiania dongpingensis]|uniref:HAD family phosphatase n=1 Tax=Qiania dongpingensis TaxID=2763669 RepID=A0A7G9G1D2_9FIRM|nr:Cof-type HAD-IIB family hydrolase [Qiania dongpingensis]QNM04614.1 HAD family phosphatase [Qiania dongpingensis]
MATRLIALDLDGTALSDHRSITGRTRSAVSDARKNGILVVPATGRSYRDIPAEVLDITEFSYFLTSNGANILDGRSRTSMYTDLIPWRQSVEILRLLEEYDVQPSVHLNGSSTNLKTADPRIVARYGSTDYFLRSSVDNLADYIAAEKTDVEKIFAILFAPSEKAALTARLTSRCPLTVSASGPDNIELNSPTASKGHGLAVLCQALNISPEETAVIGDSINDISMFRFAGRRIAMGNAEPCIMELSQHVTDTCDKDGAALAIERLIQQEW